MRVSFDLDEVLFVDPETYETEPALRFPFNRIYKERLRLGTVKLIHRLQQEGFEVWVYTSSMRSQNYIRSLFQHYGVHFNGIINLNETGAFLFGELQKGADREELIQKLLAEYDVTPEKAANDIDIFIQKAKDADVLE